MAGDKRYRIRCSTENTYVYIWADDKPTTCPNNAEHQIDSDNTVIVEQKAALRKIVQEYRDPTANDDIADGYVVGNNWVNEGTRKEFVLTDDADTKAINELDIYFSVEKFSNQDAEIISYEFDENILLVDAVHDNYILKRENSLYNSDVSVKKELPEEVPYNGYIQVVHGFNYDYDDGSSYFTATLEVGRDYYVFQLIGKKENLVYLHDDFIDLLASVTE